MSAVAAMPSVSAAIPPLPVMRFSVDQYHAMIQAGVIEEDAPVELLHGWLVPTMTKNLPPR